MRKTGETIRRFVERGGTLYASDIRYEAVIEAFPDRNARIQLDESALSKVLDLERKWLDLVAPAGHVETSYEALRKAELSPALKEKFDLLAAAVEASSLITVDANDGKAKPPGMVRRVLKRYGLGGTDADVQAVAKVMSDWEALILAKVRNNASTKTKALKVQADEAIKRQRDRLILRDAEVKAHQVVVAEVVDSGLREKLGTSAISLDFNDTAFYPSRFQGDMTVMLRGQIQTTIGNRFEVPLLVKFREGQGTVIFTSFHNAKQDNEQEEAVLRYLVLTAVTAREESKADEVMFKGGFSPAKSSQIGHMAGNASATQTYKNPGPGPLRFALIFDGADARMRLVLVAPGGQRYDQVVESTVIVEASGAPPGEWTYTVEAVKVPYANFPFGVSIGKGEAPAGRP